MDEVMKALETMMRRIVLEELAKQGQAETTVSPFRDQFKGYVDNHAHEFAALVSIGALDMPWFDEAIKAEVADAMIPSQGFTFADKQAFNMAVAQAVRESGSIGDWVYDKAVGALHDASFSIRVS